MRKQKTPGPVPKAVARAPRSQTVGESIIQGLEEAIAWTKGENNRVQVTLVEVPRSTCGKSG